MAAFVLAVAIVGCRPVPTGTLELRWHLPAGAGAGLDTVRIEPEWAGANRGPIRDADWSRIPLTTDRVAFGLAPDATGTVAPVAVARGPLPAGRWDRVFVAAPSVTARAPDGATLALTSHIEPIARGFDLPNGGRVTVDIELIVLPAPSFVGPGWQIFVKDALVR